MGLLVGLITLLFDTLPAAAVRQVQCSIFCGSVMLCGIILFEKRRKKLKVSKLNHGAEFRIMNIEHRIMKWGGSELV
ncbi:MAG: hypothetical protein DWQ02_12440 [Bacteroidetes bacterium]|nr:MAG: hypothetical protein DWQ02_12440 [Bacteroidota bacterium]